MKRILLICISMSLLSFTACHNNGKNNKEAAKDAPAAPAAPAAESLTPAFDPAALGEEPVLVMKTTMGDMTFKLYKETPQHRDNFVKLASERFYDGLLFHRVINNFMIQGGDPNSRNAAADVRLGSGSVGYTVPAEFVPSLLHKKGAIAAARTGDHVNPEKASSGSQFYIVQSEAGCRGLNGSYTVYGEVLEGLDIIDKIAAVKTNAADRPLTDVRIISIRPKE